MNAKTVIVAALLGAAAFVTAIPAASAAEGLVVCEANPNTDASTWDASNWDASNWDASNWDASNWDASNWDGSNWDGSTWDASTWDGSNWDLHFDLFGMATGSCDAPRPCVQDDLSCGILA